METILSSPTHTNLDPNHAHPNPIPLHTPSSMDTSPTHNASPAMDVDLSDSTTTESEPEAIAARPIARPPSPPLHTLSTSELISRLERSEHERETWQLSCDRTAKLFVEYRDHNNELLTERRSHKNIVSALEEQLARTTAQLQIANDRNRELKEELDGLRRDMKTGFPPLQRLEALSAEVKEGREEVAAWKQRHQNRENEANFFREQYQTASNANFANHQQVQELSREIEVLKRLADERSLKLRVMNDSQLLRAKEMEIVVLKETLKEREKKVERLEREKKERESEKDRLLRGMRGNWTTRSGSVPRRTVTPAAGVKGSPGVSPAVSRTGSPTNGGKDKGKGS
ncbi:hypothetical protein EX30DRAFT_339209 [Ascodesmis nigricans]|uniref:Uncharacterized protein n=1 Tax=Ascodesmis nigricans TaxID=341454 RepID=A0A4S2N1F2_9PEZI|nr:hypothetical protein EX30DRAFT_339209 [Ascodesmis nigricans]